MDRRDIGAGDVAMWEYEECRLEIRDAVVKCEVRGIVSRELTIKCKNAVQEC